MKKGFIYGILLIASVYFSGCAATKMVEEEKSISAERIVKRLEANRRKVKSFIGNGTITINTSELNSKSSFRAEMKKPDSLKVSFFGPFGIDLAFALITNKDFQFYDVINNKLYRGKIRPGIMKDVMKVDIPFDELMDAVTGSVNLTSKLRREPEVSRISGSEFEMIYRDSVEEKINTLNFDPIDLKLFNYSIKDMKQRELYSAKYSIFKRNEDMYLPYQIEVNNIISNQKIKIEYRSIEINKLNDKLKIEIAEDAQIFEI